MRHLNGVYTQAFNRRHGLTGHLFQGRFKAILVDTDSYLLTLCQYVELNPVRACMVERPQDWPWSSFQAHTGKAIGPDWLDVAAMARFILEREPESPDDHAMAAMRYSELVEQHPPEEIWTGALRQQIFMGSPDFVERMQARANAQAQQSSEIPKPQRAKPKQLTDWMAGRNPRSWRRTARRPFRVGYPDVGTRTRTQSVRRAHQSIDQEGGSRHEGRLVNRALKPASGVQIKDLAPAFPGPGIPGIPRHSCMP